MTIRILLLFSVFLTTASFATDLTIPHEFVSGEPALASEVNENFSATASAVSDNDARLDSLEAAVTALTTRVDDFEPSVVGYSKHFATDLIFLRDDGVFVIPYTGEPGQQSVPTPGDAVVQDVNYEFSAIPGLDTVSFEVSNDNSLIIFQANGRAYNSQFSARTSVEVALYINGLKPETGASQRLSIIGDDTLSGDGHDWNIFYTTELDAGTHNFSVMVKAFNQNEADVGIDGRSTEGFEGRVKVDIIELKLPD